MEAEAGTTENDKAYFDCADSPAYMTVFHQIQDLVRAQSFVATKLKRLVVESETAITKEEHERVLQQLQEEKAQHVKTKAHLLAEKDKLQFALCEVDILNKQLHREKQAYGVLLEKLRQKATTQGQQKSRLAEKCSEMEHICGLQDDAMATKDAEIKDLRQRLMQQKSNHRRNIGEMDIHLQQERYMAQHSPSLKPRSNINTAPWRK